MRLGEVVYGFRTLNNVNIVFHEVQAVNHINVEVLAGFPMSIYIEHCSLLGASYLTSYYLR